VEDLAYKKAASAFIGEKALAAGILEVVHHRIIG
jgi:hypothetical protein